MTRPRLGRDLLAGWRRPEAGARRGPQWLPAGLLSERNVKLCLGFSVLGSLTSAIAHGHMFTVYIFELFGDNASVGLTESVSGVTALVTALPVGLAVDSMPRTKLLRGCAVVGLLAAVLGAVSVGLGPVAAFDPSGERQKPGRCFTALLVASLALWGIFFNTSSSATQATFADSVPKGALRRDLYATKSTLNLMAIAMGPLLTLVCTVFLGNTWRVEQMMYVLLPGFLLMPLMSLLLALFEEPPIPEADELRVSLLGDGGRQGEGAGGGVEAGAASGTAALDGCQPEQASRGARAVPYLLLGAELVTSVGAGMTVKFFGLWFKTSFNFSPAGLAALQASTPLAIAAAVQALQAVARRSPVGPVPAVLAFWLCSIGLLLMMTRVADWRVVVVLHLLRTALANCKEPLARAILADFVPSSQRGRWNAVHSLTGMTWNGSAALGGWLCDRYGYGGTFAITAWLYLLAACFWLPLIPLVPRERGASPTKADEQKRGCGKDA